MKVASPPAVIHKENVSAQSNDILSPEEVMHASVARKAAYFKSRMVSDSISEGLNRVNYISTT